MLIISAACKVGLTHFLTSSSEFLDASDISFFPDQNFQPFSYPLWRILAQHTIVGGTSHDPTREIYISRNIPVYKSSRYQLPRDEKGLVKERRTR